MIIISHRFDEYAHRYSAPISRRGDAPRRLLVLAAVALLFGAAMLPAMRTMAAHGASLLAFESASSAERSDEIIAVWGDAGRRAAAWQLVLDLPFLLAYGLFAAGACTAVAERAERAGKRNLARVAAKIAWLGPLAAALDLLQNLSLAMVLAGHVEQPWPRISATSVPAIQILMGAALAFALLGCLLIRRAAPVALADDRGSQ
jgi:hypothetical protein